MKPKKGKPVKKYAIGGAIAAQAGLAGLQSLLGAFQTIGGMSAAEKLKAPSTATPSAWKDFYESAQNQSLVQQNIDQINRASATYLQALQAGGTQAVAAGLQPLAQGTQQASQDVYNQQIMREMQAAGMLAGAEERAQGRARDVYESRLGEARAAQAAGIQNIFGALGSAGKAITDLTVAGANKTAKEEPKTTTVSPREAQMRRETISSLNETGGERALIGQNLIDLQAEIDDEKVPLLSSPYEELIRGMLTEETGEYMPSRRGFNDGGMMTGGKFSHKSNPIDIVQKGKKIGEMTGGEVILNPAQQKKLSKESTYFRQLLKKFNKQK